MAIGFFDELLFSDPNFLRLNVSDESGTAAIQNAKDLDALAISGRLRTDGRKHVQVSDDVDVTGALSVGTTLSVLGALSVAQGLSVAQSLGVSGGLTVQGGPVQLSPAPGSAVQVAGDLAISGQLTAGNLVAETTTTRGTLRADSNVSVGGQLNVTGTSTLFQAELRFLAVSDLLAANGLLTVLGGIQCRPDLKVFGPVIVQGEIFCQKLHQTSDLKAKDSVEPLSGALDQLMRLRPVTFHWKEEQARTTAHKQLGLIAQDVREVLPGAVSEDEQGNLGIQYHAISCLVAKAVQEQQAQIAVLQAQIERLERSPPDAR